MPHPATPHPLRWLRLVTSLVAGLAVVGASIVLSVDNASAVGLETFSGCGELRAHLVQAATDAGPLTLDDADSRSVAVPTAESASGGDGGTNTQVAGVDELDVVEVLADGRLLVARDDRVVLVDAGGEVILATLPVPPAPQITVDEQGTTLWAVSSEGQSTTLTRAVLTGDGFAEASSWSVAGRLVDLRRDAAAVHLVVVDDGVLPMESGIAIERNGEVAPNEALPFRGTSPVPCDEVLHSSRPGGPATTLVTSFSATGALRPTAAAEIVGAGDNVLVTATALYVSTPAIDTPRPVTGIHRFDLDDLQLTGSGSVTGLLINQFALDEHDGHLRAAVTVAGFVPLGGPMAIEPDVGVVVEDTAGSAAREPAPDEPTTTTTPPVPPEPPTTTTEAPSSTTTTTEAPTTTTTVTPAGVGLSEIVTLDLDGALDVVGRSPRFGHEGETLHGIRFAGDTAYAVTFLQTDPLYVIDLADPAAPRVLGEIEIPGFSAYLHPISPTQVIGFGPGEDGEVVARLFDVGEPTAPRLLDTVRVGADSPVVWDHHALRAEGEQLLLAANDWVAARPARCGPLANAQAELEDLYRQIDDQYRQMEVRSDGSVPPVLPQIEARVTELSECVYPSTFPQARLVMLDPTGTSLRLTAVATGAGEAQRVLRLDGGDFLVVGTELTRVGSTGEVEAVLG